MRLQEYTPIVAVATATTARIPRKGIALRFVPKITKVPGWQDIGYVMTRASRARTMRLPALFVPAALALTTSAISLAQAPAYAPVGPQPGPAPAAGGVTPGYTAPSTTGYTGQAPQNASPAPQAATTPPSNEPILPEGATRQGEEKPMRSGQRWKDARVDSVVLVPTAETHPEGTFYISAVELVIPQIGWAVSDRTQITFTGTPPAGEDHIFLLDASLKSVLVRQSQFKLAAIGSVSGIIGVNQSSAFVGRVGAAAQFCFDVTCRSSANLASSWLLGGPATVNYTGLGFILRVSRAFAFLLEANTFTPFTRDAGRFNAILLGPGGRLSWDNFGVDLAFEWVADAEVEQGERIPVLPFLTFTYRFLP